MKRRKLRLAAVWVGACLLAFFFRKRFVFENRSRSSNEDLDVLSSTIAKSELTTEPTYENIDVHVFIVAPEERLAGMMATVNSVQKNTKSSVQFHLLTDTEESAKHAALWLQKKELSDVAGDIIVFNSSWIEGKFNVPSKDHRSKEFSHPLVFSKYFLPDFLPADYEGRVVYLDDDIIVQGDIRELAETAIDDNHVGSISPDCNEITNLYKIPRYDYGTYLNYKNPRIQQMKIPSRTCKINAGVMVVDVGKWRRLDITGQLVYWTELNTREEVYLHGASQTVIMMVLHNRFTPFDPLWHIRLLGSHVMNRYPDDLLYSRAKLLHWNGIEKPWKFLKRRLSNVWSKYAVADPLDITFSAGRDQTKV